MWCSGTMEGLRARVSIIPELQRLRGAFAGLETGNDLVRTLFWKNLLAVKEGSEWQKGS